MRKALIISLSIGALISIALWQLNHLASNTSLSQWESGAPGYRNAMNQRAQNNKPVLLFFHTEWCQSCKELKSNVLGQQATIEYLNNFNIVQINPEANRDNQIVADQYSVNGFPTLIMVDNISNKNVRLAISGKTSAEKFKAACENALRQVHT